MHQTTFGICIGHSDQVKLHENLYFIEQGEIGDIITLTIDLDESQTIDFYRNGIKIEKSFSIQGGTNKCFYPALTLFEDQKVEVNLGHQKFRHLEVLESKDYIPLQIYKNCFVKGYYSYANDLICLLKSLISENGFSNVLC